MNQNDNVENVDTTQESTEQIIDKTTEQSEEQVDKDAIIGRLNRELTKAKKKLEKSPVESDEPVEASSDKGLSQTDLIAIIKADIAEEDISEVRDFAQLKGISVSEAIKSPLLKNVIKENVQMRNVANATNTGNTPSTQRVASDESLLANAKKGDYPENEDDLARLVDARFENRKRK